MRRDSDSGKTDIWSNPRNTKKNESKRTRDRVVEIEKRIGAISEAGMLSTSIKQKKTFTTMCQSNNNRIKMVNMRKMVMKKLRRDCGKWNTTFTENKYSKGGKIDSLEKRVLGVEPEGNTPGQESQENDTRCEESCFQNNTDRKQRSEKKMRYIHRDVEFTFTDYSNLSEQGVPMKTLYKRAKPACTHSVASQASHLTVP